MTRRWVFYGTFLTSLFIFMLVFTGSSFGDDGGLALGSRSEDAVFAQKVLQEIGLYRAGGTAGYYGVNTAVSVATMQKEHGMKITGTVHKVEWERLREIALGTNLTAKLNKQLVGYYTQYQSKYSSYKSLSSYGEHLDYIATFSYVIDNNGDLVGETPKDALSLAREKKVKPLLLVHNMLDEIDSAGASAVLSNPSLREKLVKNIINVVERDGYSGINVDLEGVYPLDRQNYNRFLHELGDALRPAGKVLTVSIPAKTQDDPRNAWSGAYDYASIGEAADFVMLMTYDEHWYGGDPGPVASLPWVLSVLDYATSQIPREKLILGIAAYGYDWSPNGSRAITWNEVGGLAEKYGPARWHDDYCVPFLVYHTGGVRHEVWFENTYSLRFKLDLVNSYGLAGIALWRMGFEDADFWNLVVSKFG